MAVPISQMWTVATYVIKKKLAGDKPWALLEKYVGPLTS